jgi:tRNA-dihydrouridine synthase A
MTFYSPWRFSVAPMMDWTDRHFRYLCRLLSKNALLYTEMVTSGAIIHGDRDRFLAFNPEEHPVALQLGGSNPQDLANCSRLAEQYGYDEVNLNVGCPSDRVQNNLIGACLMAHPALVTECLAEMRSATRLPVTIKHRIGVDHFDSEDYLQDFVGRVAESGVSSFIVHARIAILKGLSPKENREVPPLKYEWVYNLKKAFPHLTISINGGITDLEQCQTHLKHLDGVMLGRAAYQTPWLLSAADEKLFGAAASADTRLSTAHAYARYIEAQHAAGVPVWAMARHALGLFHAQPGGRAYRRILSENAVKRDASPSVFSSALKCVCS